MKKDKPTAARAASTTPRARVVHASGMCLAELHVYDDHGNNRATVVCERKKGHEGRHRELGRRSPPLPSSFLRAWQVKVTWIGDDTEVV